MNPQTDGQASPRMRLGIDIGGTFTDVVLLSEDGEVAVWKEPTTPEEPILGMEAGIRGLAAEKGMEVSDLLHGVDVFVHGTTIATNAVIQRRGARVGLLCTKGFRDVLYFRDGFKPERFNVHLSHPGALVERYLRLSVSERIDQSGSVLTPLDEAQVLAAAERFRESDVSAITIAFLWSVVNSSHEERAEEILRSALPDVPVIKSSAVLPELGEWDRTSAAVLSAFVMPPIESYLSQLGGRLERLGLKSRFYVMQVNGGCASPEEILRRPVYVLASGPAAAPTAGRPYAERFGVEDALIVDMGGTSFDVSMIRKGRTRMSRGLRVADQPLGVAGVEVLSVGAGGGSIAWLDSGGALRVGPQSAGAVPGPACYGQGGQEPTVTDANVAVGYLKPEAFLGGRQHLDAAAARASIRDRIAEPLGLEIEEAAGGILEIVNTNMVGAIRAVSVERGIDPRGFLMIVAGGAGGLHGVAIARALGIPRVIVPKEAGGFCAFGMTMTDVRHDHVHALYRVSSELTPEEIGSIFGDLETSAHDRLVAEGFADDEIGFERWIVARYTGQVHQITLSTPNGGSLDPDAIETAFHEAHMREFTYARTELPIEVLNWQVTGVGRVRGQAMAAPAPTSKHEAPAPTAVREAYFAETKEYMQTAVYDGDALPAGATLKGPAIIQWPTTTVLVGAADGATMLEDGLSVDVAS